MDACQPPASTSRRGVLPPVLRVRPFRWYWLAQWPVLIGTWMQVVALGYFVFQRLTWSLLLEKDRRRVGIN